MWKNHVYLLPLVTVLVVLGSGCATSPDTQGYRAYREHFPKSVLVLPPLNNSLEIQAPYVYLSTVTKPLAECGYYVFPVAVIDAFLKENGMPTPGEMHTIPLDKIRKTTGADAVLYVTLEQWGQQYQILSSTTVVRAEARLVDTATGYTLWTGSARAAESSGDGGGSLVGMLIAATIDQIADTVSDRTHDLAHAANHQMVFDDNHGLLLGPRNPDYENDSRGR
ncbi:MAG: hypothetical protein GY807_06680 [Gammaproteobacteria bacterium]|nr:hypothetical protein [Gammaproteobacteria bacterium]